MTLRGDDARMPCPTPALDPAVRLLRLLHSVRHLRPGQILGRLWFRLYRPRPGVRNLPRLCLPAGPWASPAAREPILTVPGHACLLGQVHPIGQPGDWNHPRRDQLWLYHLHYFDDLNARRAGERADLHRALIERWIAENPPFAGAGWEPYPSSLRLVNWLKWVLSGHRLAPHGALSLALQARWLQRRIEWHLLGNHLFVNAKALVYAGLCCQGVEADAWLGKGLGILRRQLAEQVLADGGHCERSPMYHALILEDLLDLLNLARAWGGGQGRELPPRLARDLAGAVAAWTGAAARMQGWLRTLSHPDGEIALFNDAAQGLAPTPAALHDYAGRLGLAPAAVPAPGLTHLADTGYLRLDLAPALALLDCGAIGPDHQPGHAHADTLSFELSLWGRRLIVDSGTSRYGLGPERLRQRGTAAHNTVEIDGLDSSEVWGGFRVARRARPLGLRVRARPGELCVSCAHDGYRRLPGRPLHRRAWTLTQGGLLVRDEIQGRFRTAVARLHLHPGVAAELDADGCGGRLRWDGRDLGWRTTGAAAVRVVPSSYHPRFGVSEPCVCIELEFAGALAETRLTWPPEP